MTTPEDPVEDKSAAPDAAAAAARSAGAAKPARRRGFGLWVRRWSARLLWLLIIGVLATFALVRGSAYYFASQGADHVAEDAADVIIVLSAGLDSDSAELDPYNRARVERAIELWNRGVAPFILMSGGVHPSTGLHMAEQMKRHALLAGVPDRAVLVEGVSISTFENARFTLAVTRDEGWESAVVVSDDFHLLRAWALFSFWRQPEDLAITALVAADGRARRSAEAMEVVRVWGRETFAYPFNVMKVVGQLGLEAIGRGEDRSIR